MKGEGDLYLRLSYRMKEGETKGLFTLLSHPLSDSKTNILLFDLIGKDFHVLLLTFANVVQLLG